MIRQKPLSLKMDHDILEELEKEVSTGWKSRNRIINDAVRMYLEAKDARRRAKCAGVGSPECNKIIGLFLKRNVLPDANYYIGNITT